MSIVVQVSAVAHGPLFYNYSYTDFEYPKTWSAMLDSDNLAVVPVISGSLEYSSVIDRFQATAGKKEIVKVRVVFLPRLFYYVTQVYPTCKCLWKINETYCKIN